MSEVEHTYKFDVKVGPAASNLPVVYLTVFRSG